MFLCSLSKECPYLIETVKKPTDGQCQQDDGSPRQETDYRHIVWHSYRAHSRVSLSWDD